MTTPDTVSTSVLTSSTASSRRPVGRGSSKTLEESERTRREEDEAQSREEVGKARAAENRVGAHLLRGKGEACAAFAVRGVGGWPWGVGGAESGPREERRRASGSGASENSVAVGGRGGEGVGTS